MYVCPLPLSPSTPSSSSRLTRTDAASCALGSARGIVLALVAALDPAVARGVRVWRRKKQDEHGDGGGGGAVVVVRFTLAAGIIGVQSEIIRFVEELGLYPRGDEGWE